MPRSQTRSCCCCCSCTGAFLKLASLAIAVSVAWFYNVIQPPPPKPLGAPFGPPVTAPRVQLSDGRFLAYKEAGVSKNLATYKIICLHGFGRSRNDTLPATQSLLEDLGVYLIGFDRAGYGQSDPNPARTVKSEAYDIEELADIMELGPKFYLIATSIGGYSAWSCLKYIPHRLAGVAMLAPVTNYWWSGIPFKVAFKAFRTQPLQDQIATSVAHYAPWLTYWWNTQKLFPKSSVMENKLHYLNNLDRKIISLMSRDPSQREMQQEVIQQGLQESFMRDTMNMFGRWEFDPADLENPFADDGTGSVHIWHGDEDFLVPLVLQQQHIARRLPWVHLHIVPRAGHILAGVQGLPDEILKTLLLKET